jgi:nucleoside-diphosphate-sugar epimerase
MRLLLAGATGAVGAPLVRMLRAGGHQVSGLTRTRAGAAALQEMGADPVVADVLDRDGLLRAVSGLRADAVLHELTALRSIPRSFKGMAATNQLRTVGSANLVEAAREVGAGRFVTQSIVLGYGLTDHGDRSLTEADPFAVDAPGPAREVIAAVGEAERIALQTPGLDGVALRYGMFYGRDVGTQGMAEALRRRRMPAPRGGGVLPMLHLDDAAAATVAALERGVAGRAYNVGGDAVSLGDFLVTLARTVGAPAPLRVPVGLLRVVPYLHALLSTSIRVDCGLAERDLGWQPRYRNPAEGLAADFAGAGAPRR